jgi:hypothetical protein
MNKIDLLFIVDVTGSMGSFIESAKEKMQSILTTLSDKFKVDLKVGLSFYRDHPSQDQSFVTVTFDLLDVDNVKEKIVDVTVDGGGDFPEAVIDGIIDGIKDMTWREGSRRIAFLIGDAPAHGMVDNESCCSCGKTWGDAIKQAQNNNVVIYSILLGEDVKAATNFKLISNFTGGMLIEKKDAMDAIMDTLSGEFEDINLDAKVLEMLSKNYTTEDVCKMLEIDRNKLQASKSRIVQYS